MLTLFCEEFIPLMYKCADFRGADLHIRSSKTLTFFKNHKTITIQQCLVFYTIT